MRNLLLGAMGVVALLSADAYAYNYPIDNPYAATIVGTPDEDKYPLHPVSLDEYKVDVSKGNYVPSGFWYNQHVKFGAALQDDEKAPLIFIISGTGGSYSSPSTLKLLHVYYNAGYHVITLPSPTNPNFITTASSTHIPGDAVQDAEDLYRLMLHALAEVGGDISPSYISLSGFSLGAFNAAFVKKVDDEKKRLRFKQIVLVNPPVSLYASINRVDSYLEENIPGGMDNGNEFMNNVFNTLSDSYDYGSDDIMFSGEHLYKTYQEAEPTDEGMKALIGLAFRMSLVDMVFTSDVVTKSNYIYPSNKELNITTSLTPYYKALARLQFNDYINGLFAPYYMERKGVSYSSLLNQQSLYELRDVLKSPNIYVVHNENDIIVNKTEIEFIKSIFKGRSLIYPTGGHGGNLLYKDNVENLMKLVKVENYEK